MYVPIHLEPWGDQPFRLFALEFVIWGFGQILCELRGFEHSALRLYGFCDNYYFWCEPFCWISSEWHNHDVKNTCCNGQFDSIRFNSVQSPVWGREHKPYKTQASWKTTSSYHEDNQAAPDPLQVLQWLSNDAFEPYISSLCKSGGHNHAYLLRQGYTVTPHLAVSNEEIEKSIPEVFIISFIFWC